MNLKDYLAIEMIGVRAFARMCSVSPATICRVADGAVVPRRELMCRIHDVTGGSVTPNDLLGLHSVTRRTSQNTSNTPIKGD